MVDARSPEDWEWYCAWDAEDARALIGKRVLVGITRVDATDQPLEERQYFGIVVSADERDGIRVSCEGARAGEMEWLPPAPRLLTPAKRGSYRLRSTGETVEDPDYLSTWISKAGSDRDA